jgi:hypothetical protein
MPDSLLPIQGLAAQRERDLDALLSGAAGYPAEGLRPLAAALAALRAAPAADELDGEAAARAAFRHLRLSGASDAGGARAPVPLYEVPAPLRGNVAGQDQLDWQGSTVVLPRTVPAGPRHARPRRRAPWHGRWQVMAAACGAAAAVIVCLVALAGGFAGPAGQQGRPGPRLSVQATGTSSKRPASSVLTTATPRPVPSAVSPATLCRQYLDFFMRPQPPANWAAEHSRQEQLSHLAGGWQRIPGYCARQLGTGSSGSNPGFQGGTGDRDSGRPPSRGRSAEQDTQRLGRGGAGTPFGGR